MAPRARSLALLALGSAAGCSYDWDAYDARSAAASAASSGTGGAASSSASVGGSGATGGGGAGPASATSSSSSSTGGAGGGLLCQQGDVMACYDGPPATKGVGACQDGTQVCDAMGAFGPCTAEVLPSLELCDANGDEDCNGASNDHCATWSVRRGGGSDQKPEGLAVSPTGDSFIVGQAYGTSSFGNGPLVTAGAGDALVLEIDASGTTVWSRVFGDAATQIASGVAVAPNGDIAVAGTFAGAMTLDATALTSVGLDDAFVARLTGAGAVVWAKSFGDAVDQAGEAVAVDAGNDVIFGGSFHGTVDFGTGPKTAANRNGIVVKLDGATGVAKWAFVVGQSSLNEVLALDVDAAESVYVAGSFINKAVFGATTLTGKGSTDGFVAKLDLTGAPVWATQLASSTGDEATSLAVDAMGNVYAAGIFSGPIDFGGACGVKTNVGANDAFLVKLDANGSCVWSKTWGDPLLGNKSPKVAVDASGVLFTDEYVGVVDFGGGTVSTDNEHDVVLLAFAPDGSLRYSRVFGDSNDQDGRGIGADSSGNVYLLAEVAGQIDFGNGPLPSLGGDDLVLAKFAP